MTQTTISGATYSNDPARRHFVIVAKERTYNNASSDRRSLQTFHRNPLKIQISKYLQCVSNSLDMTSQATSSLGVKSVKRCKSQSMKSVTSICTGAAILVDGVNLWFDLDTIATETLLVGNEP